MQAELELLRQAKGALDAGDAATATARLEQHAREFPGGALRLEREALRVLARCASDRLAGAARARAFLNANPGSPLVDRVRRACGLDGGAKIEK